MWTTFSVFWAHIITKNARLTHLDVMPWVGKRKKNSGVFSGKNFEEKKYKDKRRYLYTDVRCGPCEWNRRSNDIRSVGRIARLRCPTHIGEIHVDCPRCRCRRLPLCRCRSRRAGGLHASRSGRRLDRSRSRSRDPAASASVSTVALRSHQTHHVVIRMRACVVKGWARLDMSTLQWRRQRSKGARSFEGRK